MPRPRVTSGLTARAVVVTCLAALVSVLVTALVAFPLALRAANSQVRRGLADKAQIAADLIGTRPREVGQQRLTQELRHQGIEAYLVRDGVLVGQGARLPDRIVKTLAAGKPVHDETALINGHVLLVEAQPLPGTPGSGVVLTERAVTGFGALAVLNRLWLAPIPGPLARAIARAPLGRRPAPPHPHAGRAGMRPPARGP